MPKITIIKIIHFTIDFLLAGFYMNDAKALGVFCIRSRIMYGIMFMITLPRHCKNYDE